MNFSATIHARKVAKRLRRNYILEGLREPKTIQQLELLHGIKRNLYTSTVFQLLIENYVEKFAISDEKGRATIWKALKFDYCEEGVDYDAPVTVEVPSNKIEPEKPYIGLAQAHYIHNSAHSHLAKKYKETERLTTKERKSLRVYAGIYGEITN